MQIECQLTRSLYVKINLLIIIQSWSFYLFPALLIAAIVLGFILDNFIYAIIMAAAFILVYAYAILNGAFSQRNRNFFLPVKYLFSNGAVTIESVISKNTMTWDRFVKWRKIADFYLLYTSNNSYYCIPRSTIPEGDVTGFEDLLRSKIKPAVSLLPGSIFRSQR
jgi:hypothetical protein